MDGADILSNTANAVELLSKQYSEEAYRQCVSNCDSGIDQLDEKATGKLSLQDFEVVGNLGHGSFSSVKYAVDYVGFLFLKNLICVGRVSEAFEELESVCCKVSQQVSTVATEQNRRRLQGKANHVRPET